MPLFDPSLFIAQAHGNSEGYRELIDRLARTPLSQVVTYVAVLTVIRVAIYPLMKSVPVHKRGAGFSLLRFVNELIDAFVYAGVFVFLIIRPFLLQAFLIPSGSMWPTLLVNDFIVANKWSYRFSEPKFQDIVVFRPPATAILDPNQIDEKGEAKVDFIKRLIGLPGDVIELKGTKLIRNGKEVPEPYVHYSDTQDGITFEEKTQAEMDEMTKANFKLVKWNGKVIPLNYTEFDANSPMPRGAAYMGDRPYAVAEEFFIVDPSDQRKAMELPAEKVPEGYYLMFGDNRNGSFDSRGWGLVPQKSVIGRSEVIWLPFNRWRMTR